MTLGTEAVYVSDTFLPLQINAYTHVDHVCKILVL